MASCHRKRAFGTFCEDSRDSLEWSEQSCRPVSLSFLWGLIYTEAFLVRERILQHWKKCWDIFNFLVYSLKIIIPWSWTSYYSWENPIPTRLNRFWSMVENMLLLANALVWVVTGLEKLILWLHSSILCENSVLAATWWFSKFVFLIFFLFFLENSYAITRVGNKMRTEELSRFLRFKFSKHL